MPTGGHTQSTVVPRRSAARADHALLLLQSTIAPVLPAGDNGSQDQSIDTRLLQILHWLAFTVVTFVCAFAVNVLVEQPLTHIRRLVIQR